MEPRRGGCVLFRAARLFGADALFQGVLPHGARGGPCAPAMSWAASGRPGNASPGGAFSWYRGPAWPGGREPPSGVPGRNLRRLGKRRWHGACPAGKRRCRRPCRKGAERSRLSLVRHSAGAAETRRRRAFSGKVRLRETGGRATLEAEASACRRGTACFLQRCVRAVGASPSG